MLGPGPGAFFDVGHARPINALQEENGRLLSQDWGGDWVLWDIATKQLVARGPGDTDSTIQLAGGVFTVQNAAAVELRDAGDGHLIKSIATTSTPVSPWTYGLATDGSYAWLRSPTEVQVWSPAGAPIFTHPGSYAASTVFAAPGQIRIGDKSRQTIEILDAQSGAFTLTPTFAGTFHSWFKDGGRFFSTVGNTVRVYSKDAAQAAITALSTLSQLTGQGDYFWTFSNDFEKLVAIYRVDQPAAPLTTLRDIDRPYNRLFPVGNIIGMFPYAGSNLTIVHLDPGGVSTESVPIPSGRFEAFGADSTGSWSIGAVEGVIYDRANLLAGKGPLSCGAAFDIAGANTGLCAVGTDREVLIFQSGPGGFTFQEAIPYNGSQVQVSADGTVLAVRHFCDYQPDRSIRVFSLPGATLTHTWPIDYDTNPGNYYTSITLARSGAWIGQTLRTPTNDAYTRTVTDLTGSVTAFMDMGLTGPEFFLSSDGNQVAAVDTSKAATQVYKNGTLIDATPGIPSGWIDNDRFFVQFFEYDKYLNKLYLGTAIHSVATGTTGPMLTLPCLPAGSGVIDPNHLFCPSKGKNVLYDKNVIYDLSTGAAVWTGSVLTIGPASVAGAYVVSTSYGSGPKADSYIYAEAHGLP